MIRGYDDNGNIVDLVNWETQIKLDIIDEILKIQKLNHYDCCNELMYQSIKVNDIKQFKSKL